MSKKMRHFGKKLDPRAVGRQKPQYKLEELAYTKLVPLPRPIQEIEPRA